jgi:hypothetical protein
VDRVEFLAKKIKQAQSDFGYGSNAFNEALQIALKPDFHARYWTPSERKARDTFLDLCRELTDFERREAAEERQRSQQASPAMAVPEAPPQPTPPPTALANTAGVAQYVVLLRTPSLPSGLYLQSKCSALDTKEKLSAQEWNRLAAAAAHFPWETAETLAAQARNCGARDCTFEAVPLTLNLLSEDCAN